MSGAGRERGPGAQTYAKMATGTLSFNIDSPRWDQSTFVGRLKHFLNITDPRTVLVPEEELDQAKALVESCRAGLVPPGSSQEQLLYAKKLYDSAFHPDSGEKMNLIGRMSFQVPGGMAITGCMLQFYRTVPAVVFWQWVNQSFNAFVNYTNRNAASPISLRQIGVAYVTATSAALATAVGLNLYTKRAPPLLARWVPFAAVAAANCVNIPMMRQQEIINGITVTDENNNELGHSRLFCPSSWSGWRNSPSCSGSGFSTLLCRCCSAGASSCSWCQQPVLSSPSDAPLHWLTLRWSCVTVSWPSTGTKCHMSILTKDCEWRLPQEPLHPSGLLPPPFPHLLSRVRGTVQPRSAPPPSTFSAAFFHCRIRI
ncbi:sideroflexin-2 isoform X1 [Agelaius phoeniceus]|uniref:sideroflexin-2 isoform X1 n=2 Tax=Agelaius phoeniceus TaxID=39638 RepID=UPI0023EBFD02|nr:sideroflexin-2 isoform X1 [Agelaius phoeniceus]